MQVPRRGPPRSLALLEGFIEWASVTHQAAGAVTCSVEDFKTPGALRVAAATKAKDRPTCVVAGMVTAMASCTHGICPRACRTAECPPPHITMTGRAGSGHRSYKKTNNPLREGERPKVEYLTNFPTDHELQFTNTLGRDLPLIFWESLPEAARQGLESAEFGKATVPFKDSTLQGNLKKAAL